MSYYRIGCDAHRRFSQFAILGSDGQFLEQTWVNHEPGAIREFFQDYPRGTPVTLESVAWASPIRFSPGSRPLLRLLEAAAACRDDASCRAVCVGSILGG